MPTANWSEPARDDLKQIGRYIGRQQRRPATAAKVMQGIRDYCDQIARTPHFGTARPDLGHDVRVTAYKRWVIIFRPSGRGIDVLRIVDGNRDWTALF